MAGNFLFHPVPIFLASNICLTLTAAYTQRSSPIRYLALVLLAAIAYSMPLALASYAQTTGWVGRVATGGTFWGIVTLFDRLILREWDFEHYCRLNATNGSENESKNPPKQRLYPAPSPKTRMDFASVVSGDARGVGTFWQVKNVPFFSDVKPTLVPSRTAFVLKNVVAAIASYYLHNLSVRVTLGLHPQYFDSARIPLLTRLNEISLEELRARTIIALGYWVVQYCMLQFFYSLGGIASALSSPKDIPFWRPMFDSFSESYSVRNFWGKSWHQDLRSGLEGVAEFCAHRMLQLPRHGPLQRYTKIYFSFLLSGIMHAQADRGGGVLFTQSGAIRFFSMQALGILIEDSILAVYGSIFNRDATVSKLAGRWIGYAWVAFFLIWTTPVYVFRPVRSMKMEDALLGWDGVRPVLFGR